MNKIAFVVLAILLVAPSHAVGQVDGPADDAAEVVSKILATNETWEGEDREVDEDFLIENGTELVIRGINVTFRDVNVTVAPAGKLVVESLPDRAARLVSEGSFGLTVMSRGAVEIRGLAGAPVHITGLRGIGFANEQTVSFVGGVTANGGSIEAHHLSMDNYTSGILVTNQANASFFDLRMNSSAGIGLVVSVAGVVVENATFSGGGGRLYVTTPGAPVRVTNVSIVLTPRAFTFRHVFDAQITNITARFVEECAHLLGVQTLTIDRFQCTDFTLAGVRIRPAAAARALNANLTLRHFRAATASDVPAILAERPTNLTIRDSVIGPVNWSGIVVKVGAPHLENVTFTGVRDYNVEILDVIPTDLPTEILGQGQSGGEGWLLTSYSSAVFVSDADGRPANNSNVTITSANGTLVAQGVTRTGAVLDLILESHRIGPDGVLVPANYTVTAVHPTLGTVKQDGIQGTGGAIRVQFPRGAAAPTEDVPEPGRKAPGLAPFAILAAVAAIAVMRRRP